MDVMDEKTNQQLFTASDLAVLCQVGGAGALVARVDKVLDDGSVQLTVGGAHLAASRGLVGGQVTIAGVVST